MNAVSKVLIVLIFLMSVGFAVSQIILFGKRDNYGRELAAERDRHRTTSEALTKAEGALEDMTQDANHTRVTLQASIAALEGDLQAERQTTTDLRAEYNTLSATVEAQANAVTTAVSRHEEGLETQEQLNDQIDQLNTTIKEKLAEISDLDAVVAERDATIDTLNHDLAETKRAYQQTSKEEERLLAIIAELTARDVYIPPAPVPVINGRVVRVDTAHMVAVVDKGKQDGVKPNTQFTLYGDEGDYVAKLVIDNVHDEVSVGRVRLLQEGQEVIQGLNATTEIP